MLKYCKNLILCGDIDFFCLLCKESFETHDEVEKHIRWEQHRKLMKVQEYLPKFRKDGIYKLVDKYFCENCNFITPAFNTIKTHVKEESHKTKILHPESIKNESLVKRDFDFVVVSKIVMNKKEWHGVINNQCLFCNTAVDDFSTHKTMPCHIISLIQGQIIKEDEQIYRKINEDTFYCFHCKKSFFREFLSHHWTSEEHVGKTNGKVKPMFDIVRETATCVLCNETMLCSWSQMYEHKKAHIKKGEWMNDDDAMVYEDKGKVRSELKNYGKDNFIKLNEGGSKGYCSLCNTYISAHIINFHQHVNGIRHKGFLELKGLVKQTKTTEKPHYETQPFIVFVKELIHVKSTPIFLVPSAELCIDLMSMTMLRLLQDNSNKFVCFVCDGTKGVFEDVAQHLNTDHKYKLFQANVITSLKEEFIREIRPGLYHCGVCNEAYAGWSMLEKHCALLRHRYTRMKASTMIEDYVGCEMVTLDGNHIDTSGFFDIQPDFLD